MLQVVVRYIVITFSHLPANHKFAGSSRLHFDILWRFSGRYYKRTDKCYATIRLFKRYFNLIFMLQANLFTFLLSLRYHVFSRPARVNAINSEYPEYVRNGGMKTADQCHFLIVAGRLKGQAYRIAREKERER